MWRHHCRVQTQAKFSNRSISYMQPGLSILTYCLQFPVTATVNTAPSYRWHLIFKSAFWLKLTSRWRHGKGHVVNQGSRLSATQAITISLFSPQKCDTVPQTTAVIVIVIYLSWIQLSTIWICRLSWADNNTLDILSWKSSLSFGCTFLS